jgi:hypothetical protein
VALERRLVEPGRAAYLTADLAVEAAVDRIQAALDGRTARSQR